MSAFLRLSLVALGLVSLYTLFANSIPQIEQRPPEEVDISGALSGEELAVVGEAVYFGKGGCATCHSIGESGPRAPDLAGVGARAGETAPGLSAEAYLMESLVDPCAHVVEGYECIMPRMDEPPADLSAAELVALVAFLQSLGGEITVQLSEEELGTEEPSPAAAPLTAARTPQELIRALGCQACHVVPGFEPPRQEVGPTLEGIASRAAERIEARDYTGEARTVADYLRESILEPNAYVVEGYDAVMPPIFGERMTAAQLETLVRWLSEQE